eukprot:Awhi_evm1s1838
MVKFVQFLFLSFLLRVSESKCQVKPDNLSFKAYCQSPTESGCKIFAAFCTWETATTESTPSDDTLNNCNLEPKCLLKSSWPGFEAYCQQSNEAECNVFLYCYWSSDGKPLASEEVKGEEELKAIEEIAQHQHQDQEQLQQQLPKEKIKQQQVQLSTNGLCKVKSSTSEYYQYCENNDENTCKAFETFCDWISSDGPNPQLKASDTFDGESQPKNGCSVRDDKEPYWQYCNQVTETRCNNFIEFCKWTNYSIVSETSTDISTSSDVTPLTLRKAASRHNLNVGGTINWAYTLDPTIIDHEEHEVEKYLNLTAKEFNWITEENGCKWRYSVQHSRKNCLGSLEFAEANNMKFRGHALIWGKPSSNPDFFDEECVKNPELPARCKSEIPNYTKEEKINLMKEHIKEELNFYGSRIAAWDVVNEAVCDCGTDCKAYVQKNPGKCALSYSHSDNSHDGGIKVYLKKNIYYPDIPNYIEIAFSEARKYADESVLLGYNEYKFESMAWESNSQKLKSDMTFQLIKSMKEKNVPIDYIGSQNHIGLSFSEYEDFYIQGVKDNMRRYENIDMAWHFTEISIVNDVFSPWSEGLSAIQASLFKNLIIICLESEICQSFQTWGVLDDWTKAYNNCNALLFDENYEKKQAALEVLN